MFSQAKNQKTIKKYLKKSRQLAGKIYLIVVIVMEDIYA
jgi:hypothetical protein